MNQSNQFGQKPEEKLFLELAQKNPAVRDLKITASFNWERFLKFCELSGLGPLVYLNLKNNPAEINLEILEKLKSKYWANVLKIFSNWPMITKFFKTLENSGRKAVPFKGLVLAFELFGEFTLRESIDLDILVKTEDFPKLLTGLAEEFILKEIEPEGIPFDDFFRHHAFIIKDKKTLIPLFVEFHKLPEEGANFKVWERLVLKEINGLKIWCLCPEDHLIFLVRNFWHHLPWQINKGPDFKVCFTIFNYLRLVLLNQKILLKILEERQFHTAFYVTVKFLENLFADLSFDLKPIKKKPSIFKNYLLKFLKQNIFWNIQKPVPAPEFQLFLCEFLSQDSWRKKWPVFKFYLWPDRKSYLHINPGLINNFLYYLRPIYLPFKFIYLALKFGVFSLVCYNFSKFPRR